MTEWIQLERMNEEFMSARQAQGKNGNLKAILCSDCDHC